MRDTKLVILDWKRKNIKRFTLAPALLTQIEKKCSCPVLILIRLIIL